MLTSRDLKNITELNPKLSEKFVELHITITEFEEKHTGDKQYHDLVKFEKENYGEMSDFSTHTKGLLALVGSCIDRLIKFDDTLYQENIPEEQKTQLNERQVLEKIYDVSSKKSILKKSLPELLPNLEANIAAFAKSVPGVKSKTLCLNTLALIEKLKKELSTLQQKLDPKKSSANSLKL